MEIAAAIAQAQAEDRSHGREELDDGLESEEVDEARRARRAQGGREAVDKSTTKDEEGGEEDAEGEVDEDPGDEKGGREEDEEFPEPLRARKGPVAGGKRKRS